MESRFPPGWGETGRTQLILDRRTVKRWEAHLWWSTLNSHINFSDNIVAAQNAFLWVSMNNWVFCCQKKLSSVSSSWDTKSHRNCLKDWNLIGKIPFSTAREFPVRVYVDTPPFRPPSMWIDIHPFYWPKNSAHVRDVPLLNCREAVDHQCHSGVWNLYIQQVRLLFSHWLWLNIPAGVGRQFKCEAKGFGWNAVNVYTTASP